MRKQFCEAETREEAQAECPWACEIIGVEGGWMCFESVVDYDAWVVQL